MRPLPHNPRYGHWRCYTCRRTYRLLAHVTSFRHYCTGIGDWIGTVYVRPYPGCCGFRNARKKGEQSNDNALTLFCDHADLTPQTVK